MILMKTIAKILIGYISSQVVFVHVYGSVTYVHVYA